MKMSRRKQSVPCKVPGSDSSESKEERGTDLLKLHSLTDSLLSKTNDLYDNTLNTTPDSSSVSLREFALPPSRLHSHDVDQEQAYIAADVISSKSSQTPTPDMEVDEEVTDPKQIALDNKKQRFSARLRARLHSMKKSNARDQSYATKRKASEMDNGSLTKKMLLMLDDEDNAMTPIHNRTRTFSSEEELICPVCHKAFKSKYGLLTHSEIHCTPELKCSSCSLSFQTRSALITHQCAQHSSAQNGDYSNTSADPNNEPILKPSTKMCRSTSGFADISFIDFTCNGFPAISEDICSRSLHRLTERDRRYFFMCKHCSLLYPTISALKCHVNKFHPDTDKDHCDGDKPVDADAESSSTERLSPDKDVDKCDRMKYLSLTPVSSVDSKASSLKTLNVDYNMDNETVRTAPMTACLNVPQWLRPPGAPSDVIINDQDFVENRPPLKIKLVRRRDDEGNPISLVSNYFVDEHTDDSYLKLGDDNQTTEEAIEQLNGRETTCGDCGIVFVNETALGGHRASTACGIGIRPSSSGRRMFWCRLCNYASFEKSTILRHQRTHTGVRPYSCKFCDIAFTTKANCERHIRKRHQMRVTSDVDVKNSVFCDYELLKKARDGEINIPHASQVTGSRFLSFQCRSCRAVFSSRSNGVRHVMSKHGVLSRKGANELIACVRVSQGKFKQLQIDSSPGHHQSESVPPGHGRKGKSLANLLKMNGSSSPSLDMDGDSKRSSKPSRLIPLMKIRAYNESSKKLLFHFQKNYDDVLSAANIDHTSQDARAMSSKLLSLIVSSASMIKQGKAVSQSGFTPVDELPDSSFHQRSSMEVDSSNNEALDYSMKSFGGSSNSNQHSSDEYQDFAQLYADGQFADNYSDLHLDADSFASLDQMGSFKPWLDADDAAFLHQPSNDLASVEDLMDLAQQSSMVPSSHDEADEMGDFPHKLIHKRSSSGDMKGKYQMVMAKSKLDDEMDSDMDRHPLTWKFIPEPPKMRDEKGRYIRNPHSPYPSVKSDMTSYSHHDDRPTMVSLQSGQLGLSVDRKKNSFIRNKGIKGRKCPKCDKIFPWASSLSRHIMTHTGLKPFMCARCNMRFTTRSNLLRHAYRRHGLVRGSEERHHLLVTLSMNEQKAHAEKEAEKLIEQEEEDMMEEVDELVNEPRMEEVKQINGNVFGKMETDAAHFNKRYICGLCRLPFANRSNLVRHLHRLHNITKDHSNFRSLLIRISKGVTSAKSNPSVQNEVTPKHKVSSASLVNGTTSSPKAPNSHHVKAFTCSICSIGFTKRNNAARHIQHQHNISRKSLNFHQLIIRNHVPADVKFDGTPTTNGIENEGTAEAGDIGAAFDGPDEPSLVDESLEGNAEDSFENESVDGANKQRPSVQLTIDCGAPMEAEYDLNQPINDDLSLPLEASPIGENILNPQPIREKVNEAEQPLTQSGKRRYNARKKIKQEMESSGTTHSLVGRQHKKKDLMKDAEDVRGSLATKQNKRKDRLAQFVCGVCKRIHKNVEELKLHLEDHNIPHPWHCSICDVPFTNKYNCQRHLMRRHGASGVEPKFVEDVKHGPRYPRKRSKGYGR